MRWREKIACVRCIVSPLFHLLVPIFSLSSLFRRALAEEERRVKKEFRGKELAARLQAMQDRQLDACERLSAYKANMHGAKAG